MCLSQPHNIHSKSLIWLWTTPSDLLWLLPALAQELRAGADLARESRGSLRGEERRAPTLHRANMLHSLHIINKQSLGCQMLQYWIWISWPSTSRRLLNCFLRILSNGPTFSCENSWVLFAMPWDMTITGESNNLESSNECLAGLWLTFTQTMTHLNG